MEKISFLEKNIAIYESQLKERKQFCEKVIGEKTKLQKELLLSKKIKMDTKSEESSQIQTNLMDRINRLVELEQNKQRKIEGMKKTIGQQLKLRKT